MKKFRKVIAALLTAAVLLSVGIGSASAASTAPYPANRSVTACGLRYGGEYSLTPAVNEAWKIITRVKGEASKPEASPAPVDLTFWMTTDLAGGDQKYVYEFRTDGSMEAYTVSNLTQNKSAQTRSTGTVFRGSTVVDAKKALIALTETRMPSDLLWPRENTGSSGLYLMNSTEKLYVKCPASMIEGYKREADFSSGLKTGGTLGNRLTGMNLVEVQSRPIKARYELYENGVKVKWAGVDDPGVTYPERTILFTKEDLKTYQQYVSSLQDVYRKSAPKGPSWLGQVNPGRIQAMRMYTADGTLAAERKNPSDAENTAAFLKSIRVNAPADSNGKAGAVISSARRIEVDFQGNIRYTMYQKGSRLLINSSDVDYSVSYELNGESQKLIDSYYTGSMLKPNPEVG